MTSEAYALSIAQERWDARHDCDICGLGEDDCTCFDEEERS